MTGEVEIWSVNANRRGSAARILEEAEATGMRLPDYVLVQERRCKSRNALEAMARRAKPRGWTGRAGAANPTGEALMVSSGGTAVPASKARGSARTDWLRDHWSHRWSIAVGNIGLQVQVVIGPVYMEHSTSLAGDNAKLPADLAAALRAGRPSWIVGGGWIMGPSMLGELATRAGGALVTGGSATLGDEGYLGGFLGVSFSSWVRF